jgi:hypothetical protein
MKWAFRPRVLVAVGLKGMVLDIHHATGQIIRTGEIFK